MRKSPDDIFSALMLTAAVAVLLAGGWCLSHSIARVGTGSEPMIVAQVHLETPKPDPSPVPAPPPMPEPTEQPFYNPSIPLSQELQEVLYEACAASDVPMALALGVIQVESCFYPEADNGQCYGLMQLNRDYFPDKLSQADNLRAGVEHLGHLLIQYGDTGAALTAYNAGWDTGSRVYADAVLEAAEWWEARE